MNPADPAEELLDRVRAGDRAALDELLAGQRDRLRRFIDLRLDDRVRGRIDASDVVQEAHLEVARRIDDFLARRPMPFHTWVCRTAHQQMLRLRRQHVETGCRGVGGERPLPDRSSVLLARHLIESTPSLHLAQAEASDRVLDAVARLDETDREILLMRTFDGLSNVEAAQVLDLDPAAASKRYGRALLRLKHAMGVHDSTGS
jgi:RNA polymerase sigma-70 factor (ECF subfamily)